MSPSEPELLSADGVLVGLALLPSESEELLESDLSESVGVGVAEESLSESSVDRPSRFLTSLNVETSFVLLAVR